jgi:hypothetical protein
MTTPAAAGSALAAPTLAVALVLACGGWGWLLSRLVRRKGDPLPSAGDLAVTGCCVISTLGGDVIVSRAFSPLLAGLFLLPAVVPIGLLVQRRSALIAEARRAGAWLIGCVGLWLMWIYVPPAINGNDDGAAYLALTRKIVEQGGLGPEPFSERRFFSLGGHQIFMAIEQAFLPERWLGVVQPCLGLALLLLVLRDVGRRWKTPPVVIGGLALAVLASVGAGSSVLGNLMPVYLISALTASLISHAVDVTPERVEQPWFVDRTGLLCAGLLSLRTTSLPLAGALACFSLFPDRRVRVRAWAQAVFAGAVLLVSYMLCSRTASHTPLFPFLGRGWHGSATSGFPSPTDGLSWLELGRNVVLAPIKNPLAWLTGIVAFAAWRTGWKRLAWMGVACLATELVIAVGTGGVASVRYSFPYYLGFIIAAVPTLSFAGRSVWIPWGRRALILGTVAVVGVIALRGREVQALVVSKLAMRWQWAVPDADTLASYHRAQWAVPTGASILVTAPQAYLLDFKRNIVVINDQPGAAGPPPGWPRAGGGSISHYLFSSDVDYVLVETSAIADIEQPSAGVGWLANLNRANARWASALRAEPFASHVVYRDAALTVFAVTPERR